MWKQDGFPCLVMVGYKILMVKIGLDMPTNF